MRATIGILDSGGIAVLTATPVTPVAGGTPGQIALGVAGFGPHGSALAADLVAHVQAWDRAGQPGATGLHVDAYPRSSPAEPASVRTVLIERPRLLIERPRLLTEGPGLLTEGPGLLTEGPGLLIERL